MTLSEALTHSNTAVTTHEQARIDLAACFRWTARLDMHEAIANHFSFAVSSDGAKFLVNPFGRQFSTMRASDLLLIDANDPRTRERPDVDRTAWCIHGAIHRRHPHARCIMHVHSRFATALACLEDPSMPPIDQTTMRFYGRVAVDTEFDGMGLDEEAERLATRVGDKPILLMGNHGVMAVGSSIAEVFDELYYFERACKTLITALSTGRRLRIVPEEVALKTAEQWRNCPESAQRHLASIREILDAQEPDYRH